MRLKLTRILTIRVNFMERQFPIIRKQEKFLLLLRFLRNFADFSKPFLTFSLSKCRILLNLLFLLFLPYLLLKLSHSKKNSRYLWEFFCGLHEALHELFYFCDFSYSKKNSRYFCDFCETCSFFYTFLIAVFFSSFLLKLRRDLVSKLLL